jgi:hypothetical protein
VLEPGGILTLTSDWRGRGTPAGRGFSSGEARRIIDHPSFRLPQPIADRVRDRGETRPVDLRVDRLVFLEECG